jgi:tRNA wybutosine-synthesizing protein 3
MDFLTPDYLDDPSEVLVSFPDIKVKTTETLYQGGSIDKSPKGSVDEPIRPLVDLINQHPSFSTLSSCSGRISLFQPWKSTNEEEEGLEEDNNHEPIATSDDPEVSHRETGTPFSGKGRGGWLLVSHEVIDPSQLLAIFQNNQDIEEKVAEENNADRVLMFKVEPMLLHIAAATHERGRQLLALALELGYRESGLVIPSKRNNNRVTVAIRGMGLALAVPLAFQGPLKPSPEYLRALVEQSNQRLERNQTKLQRLFQRVQQTLFRPRVMASLDAESHWRCSPLPDLNLWGHGAVVLPAAGLNNSSSDLDVLVFGGYGHGPKSADETGKGKVHCKRLADICYLQRRGGQWDTEWTRIQPAAPTSFESFRLDSLRIDVKPFEYTPREGSAVMWLETVRGQSTNKLVFIWGGRKSPQFALNDFILYNHGDRDHPFVTPTDVRGELPEARWGHTLTRWSLDHGDSSAQRIALLVGGRNTRAAINTAHILSLIKDDTNNGMAHFLWNTVVFPTDSPQPPLPCHHAAALIPDADSISVFIYGGQLDPCNLLEAFSSDDMAGNLECGDRNHLGRNRHIVSAFTLPVHFLDGCLAERCELSLSPSLNECLGVGSAVTMLDGWTNVMESGVARHRSTTLLLTGGVVPESGNLQDAADHISTVLRFLKLTRMCLKGQLGNEWTVKPSSIHIPFESDEFKCLNESTMVHHRALAVPSVHQNGAEVLMLGGGVMGFAFGPCFSG